MLVLLVLIVSWLLRACAPVDPLLNHNDQSRAHMRSDNPLDITRQRSGLLGQTMADGNTLAGRLAAFKPNSKARPRRARHRPFKGEQLGEERGLNILKGCWVADYDTVGVRGDISSEREDNGTTQRPLGCVSTPMGLGKSRIHATVYPSRYNLLCEPNYGTIRE